MAVKYDRQQSDDMMVTRMERAGLPYNPIFAH